MDEYKQFIAESNDFMALLSMLDNLHCSNTRNQIYVKTSVSEYMPAGFNSYKEIMLLGREKLISLAKQGVEIPDDFTPAQVQIIKDKLKGIFNEPFGTDCFKFWGSSINEQQLEKILTILNLDEIINNKIKQATQGFTQQNS